MIVEIGAIPQTINPVERERVERITFNADEIISVREYKSIVNKSGLGTKIIFRGDRYEHHCIETTVPYEEVLKMVGWSETKQSEGEMR